MTIQEFHNNFNLEFDKTLDFEFPYIQPEQIDYWLNKAQDRFIEDRAYPINKNKAGFEQDQKRVDDLSSIVKTATLTPILVGTTYTIVLPEDYRHLVRHKCTTSTTCGTQEVGGEQTTHEYINKMVANPFWEPVASEPLFYFMGNTIVYETKGNFTLVSVTINYIKTPVQMAYGSTYVSPTADVECELSKNVHHKILDIAVSMVLENTESQRYQTNLNELNNTE